MIVNTKREATLLQGFEYGLLRVPLSQHFRIIAGCSIRRRWVHVQPIRLRLRRQRREPPVTNPKLCHQLTEHRQRLRFEPLHHRLRQPLLLGLRLLSKAIHRRTERLRRGCGVRGPWATEDLLVDGLKGVAWVWVHVASVVSEVDDGGIWIGGGDGVGLGSGDAVDFRVEGLHPPKHVVEWAVLLDQNDDGFDGGRGSHWFSGWGRDERVQKKEKKVLWGGEQQTWYKRSENPKVNYSNISNWWENCLMPIERRRLRNMQLIVEINSHPCKK